MSVTSDLADGCVGQLNVCADANIKAVCAEMLLSRLHRLHDRQYTSWQSTVSKGCCEAHVKTVTAGQLLQKCPQWHHHSL